MRVSRLRFKYVLRQCRANEEMMRADTLAHSLSSRDSTSFWKDVGKMANSKVPLASKVENAVGNHQITDMWKIHFSDLLNSVLMSYGAMRNNASRVIEYLSQL